MNSEQVRRLIQNVDYQGLEDVLTRYPELTNEGIALDEQNTPKAHPLHRICDGVFAGQYSDKAAAELAKIFLVHGAHIDGFGFEEKRDTPLIAAASLQADEVALLYIESGANIYHGGCHGGTALHWASWCGRDRIVKRLLQEDIDINRRCIDFMGTALLWAVHGYKFGGEKNNHHQIECARMLLAKGADKTIPNIEGFPPIAFLDDGDVEIKKILA